MDEVNTGGGASIGGDALAGRDVVGRDVRRRSYRDSHDVTVSMNESLRNVENELMQLRIDVKLIYAMSEERRLQVMQLQGWVIIMGITLLLQSFTFALFVIFTWH